MEKKNPIIIDETFDLAFRFITETNEHVFLTGKAGTGKTTFLRYLRDHSTKNIVVAAPTGVAAINAGGVTLHSLLLLPLHPFIPTEAGRADILGKLKLRTNRLKVLRKMDLLVIDEVSMVRCDVMDAVDTVLRSVRRRPDLPFGGVQMLFIGDLFQLPPVAPLRDWEVLREYYNSEFFFDSRVIQEEMPLMIELKKVYRQKEDTFISLLNKVRNDEMEQEDFEELNQRFQPGFSPHGEEKFITLTSHNVQADRINGRELSKILEKSFVFKAEITGDFPESMYPADESLELKTGAQVMFLKNDPEKRFYNGKIGTITSLDDEKVFVDCDGESIEVITDVWENESYAVNGSSGKLEQKLLGTFKQIPLRLAWAITIHKSQGLTFDRVMIDAAFSFSSGQVYVALSRCTSIGGVVLLSRIPPAAIHCNEAVVDYHRHTIPPDLLAERFKGARQVYSGLMLEEIFSFDGIHQHADLLEARIIQYNSKLSDGALSWIQDFKAQLSSARVVGLKFVNYIGTWLAEDPVIEKNAKLQKRIMDAADHFLPILNQLKSLLLKHPINTESREAATAIEEMLTEMSLMVHRQIYHLGYCRNPFSVTGFLNYKLRYLPPRVSLHVYAADPDLKAETTADSAFYNQLKHWRDQVCSTSGLPIYMVCNRASLIEISTYLPQSEKELMKIKGFGPAKVRKYGDEILEMVQDHCARNSLTGRMDDLERKVKKKNEKKEKIPTRMISFQMFQEGKSITTIAEERKMAVSTIESHLASFVYSGQIDIDRLVPPEMQATIREVAEMHGWEGLKVIKENLPKNITYGQISMVKAAENVESKSSE